MINFNIHLSENRKVFFLTFCDNKPDINGNFLTKNAFMTKSLVQRLALEKTDDGETGRNIKQKS